MKDITQTANVYQTGTVTKRLENQGELGGASFVGAPRNTDETYGSLFSRKRNPSAHSTKSALPSL